MDALDELCPKFVGSEALSISLTDPLAARRSFSPVTLSVDYSGAGDVGVRLPLELLFMGPGMTLSRTYFRRVLPTELAVTPREGGQHVVVLREMGHHRLMGKLSFDVEGDRTETL